MELRELTRWTIFVGSVVTFIALTAYLWKFNDGTFSTNKGDWGTFGDYFGGILNPLAGVVSLILLSHVSLQVAKIDENRSKTEIASQKAIALSNLKIDAYKKLDKLLSKFENTVIPPNPGTADKLLLLREQYINYFIIYTHLIDFKGSNSADVIEMMTQIIETAQEVDELSEKSTSEWDKHYPKLVAQIILQLQRYNQDRSSLIQFVFRAAIA